MGFITSNSSCCLDISKVIFLRFFDSKKTVDKVTSLTFIPQMEMEDTKKNNYFLQNLF